MLKSTATRLISNSCIRRKQEAKERLYEKIGFRKLFMSNKTKKRIEKIAQRIAVRKAEIMIDRWIDHGVIHVI